MSYILSLATILLLAGCGSGICPLRTTASQCIRSGTSWVSPLGILDTSFGTSGSVTIPTGFFPTANTAAIQTDGKILVGGVARIAGNYNFIVARTSSNGDLDTAFGSGGVANTDLAGGWDTGRSLALQPNGQILLAGTSALNDLGVVRYNTSDGSPDTSFGTAGIVTSDLGGGDDSYAVALQSSGKIILVGTSDVMGTSDFAVARLTTSGALDTSFGLSSGFTITDLQGQGDYAYSLAIQPDDKIIIAGNSFNGVDGDFAITRYTSNGVLDTSFGTGGIRITDFGLSDESISSVALQPDGKIVVAGVTNKPGVPGFAIARYSSSGNLDTTFGSGGYTITNFSGNTDSANSIIVQPDGKLLVGGSITNAGFSDFAIARYTSQGQLDTSFGNGGTVTTDFANNNDSISQIALTSSGKIIAIGSAKIGGVYVFTVARYR